MTSWAFENKGQRISELFESEGINIYININNMLPRTSTFLLLKNIFRKVFLITAPFSAGENYKLASMSNQVSRLRNKGQISGQN